MNIGVTSTTRIKLDAVRNVYPEDNIIAYSTVSGVGEQPVGDDTLKGARNRIRCVPLDGLDLIVSIENGIFQTKGLWVDRAVVILYHPKTRSERIGYSEPIVFPKQFVDKARAIGFTRTTVGQVMAAAGYIRDSQDPHATITGVSRKLYLEKVLKEMK